MSASEIAHARLQRQRIAGAGFETAAEVVRWMGAVQAQDYRQALWAIGIRMREGTVTHVEEAIDAGEIVRTWPMRGTLHFVAAQDARWMLELSAARMAGKGSRRLEQLELDESILEQCQQVIERALRGEKQLPRARLMALQEEAGISTTGQRGYHILVRLALSGVICLGPMEGRQQTFVLLEEWVPASGKLAREEAIVELALRYFTSHGLANVHDFAWWAGLTVSDAKAGLEGAKPGLTAMAAVGRECWLGSDGYPDHSPPSAAAFLLPGFDEYLLGYRDRTDVLASEHAGRIVPGGNSLGAGGHPLDWRTLSRRPARRKW